jgi:hypothetical protein
VTYVGDPILITLFALRQRMRFCLRLITDQRAHWTQPRLRARRARRDSNRATRFDLCSPVAPISQSDCSLHPKKYKLFIILEFKICSKK